MATRIGGLARPVSEISPSSSRAGQLGATIIFNFSLASLLRRRPRTSLRQLRRERTALRRKPPVRCRPQTKPAPACLPTCLPAFFVPAACLSEGVSVCLSLYLCGCPLTVCRWMHARFRLLAICVVDRVLLFDFPSTLPLLQSGNGGGSGGSGSGGDVAVDGVVHAVWCASVRASV